MVKYYSGLIKYGRIQLNSGKIPEVILPETPTFATIKRNPVNAEFY